MDNKIELDITKRNVETVKKKTTVVIKPKDVFGHLFGISLVVICCAPIFVVFVASLKDLTTYEGFNFTLSGFTFKNYVELLTTGNMIRWITNTIFVCSTITILMVVIDLMAAFVFAKLKFKGKNALFLMFISTMMLPFSITLIPTYILVAKYGMIDSYTGLILPALSAPLGIYLIRQFILTIPDSLIESARIDGATTLQVFLKIIAPLCVQPVAVLAILTFVGNWNNFLWPLLISRSDEMKTLTVGIASTNQQYAQNLGGIAAGTMISLIPMVILFFAFQRFFLKGITSGALKG